MITMTANELMRNDRVKRFDDELAYLIDGVITMQDGTVRVTYSSGDVVDYASDEELNVIG